MYIGGLDIGTTGCKLTVFDADGRQLDRAYCDYPVTRAVGAHEVDANAILEGVYHVIGEIAQRYPDITGIGITSFGETFVLADESGNPLYPSMLYTDPRGSEQVAEICRRIDAGKVAGLSGIKPHEMYSLPKIMWLKEHEPKIYAEAKHVFLMEDFVVFHLTGQAKIDYSLATRTMGFDIRTLKWSEELFEAAGIDVRLMSEPVPTGTVAGTITESAANRTGLGRQTKIVCISHDQIAAAVGAGVFDSDTAVDGAGTVECITPIYDEIPDMEVMAKGNYAVVPYVIPGKYVCYAFSYTGGALMQWCTDTLAKQEKEQAKEMGISVNELLERQYRQQYLTGETETVGPRGDARETKDDGALLPPSGLLILPHFAGAATPYMDTGSKGAILGLTTASTVADIYRGCMEGVVYEMAVNLEWLKESGIHFDKLHATGGGAHSKEWMQMKADVLDMEIIALETVDAGTVGSAMLTGIAVGCFTDLEDAAKKMVHEVAVYRPRKEMHEKYMGVFCKYKRIYGAVRPLV